jgi:hypothetical protein
MSSKREIELRKLLYEKSKLINQTKKEVKKLRLELNNIERSKK